MRDPRAYAPTAHARPPTQARIAANYSELGSQATSSSSGSGTRNLINTPPPSFQRAPPPGLPYPPFPPVALRTASSDLSKGFPKVPPPPPGGEPHPFATHDVHEEDWTRFLNDVKEAAALSTTDRSVSNVAPLALGVSFGVGMYMCAWLSPMVVDVTYRQACSCRGAFRSAR